MFYASFSFFYYFLLPTCLFVYWSLSLSLLSLSLCLFCLPALSLLCLSPSSSPLSVFLSPPPLSLSPFFLRFYASFCVSAFSAYLSVCFISLSLLSSSSSLSSPSSSSPISPLSLSLSLSSQSSLSLCLSPLLLDLLCLSLPLSSPCPSLCSPRPHPVVPISSGSVVFSFLRTSAYFSLALFSHPLAVSLPRSSLIVDSPLRLLSLSVLPLCCVLCLCPPLVLLSFSALSLSPSACSIYFSHLSFRLRSSALSKVSVLICSSFSLVSSSRCFSSVSFISPNRFLSLSLPSAYALSSHHFFDSGHLFSFFLSSLIFAVIRMILIRFLLLSSTVSSSRRLSSLSRSRSTLSARSLFSCRLSLLLLSCRGGSALSVSFLFVVSHTHQCSHTHISKD
ncbi:hypothetical protein C7M84_021684 [Penaeus vannamei]|uniref:Uncharacterized protein n=1 Tax=Penaeus vannamei TaxID=6689 RepID=A0A423S939_PENVA|nr:hypothetical protein C7M84_021684 [Penaeus vannamei]